VDKTTLTQFPSDIWFRLVFGPNHLGNTCWRHSL